MKVRFNCLAPLKTLKKLLEGKECRNHEVRYRETIFRVEVILYVDPVSQCTNLRYFLGVKRFVRWETGSSHRITSKYRFYLSSFVNFALSSLEVYLGS